MAYTQQLWADGPAGNTPVNAARLNNMETGIGNAASTADSALTAAGTKAPLVHTHATGDITALLEYVQDSVAAMVVAGANITKTYDDTAGTLTIASTGGGTGTLDTEAAQDLVNAMVIAGAGVTKTYDDTAGTLTIALNLTLAVLPAGSVIYTNSTVRPTTRTDLLCIFNGADPGGNALDNDLWFRATGVGTGTGGTGGGIDGGGF